MAEKLTGQDISFLTLQTAVFCVECELISKNNTPHCMACGSRAVLSLVARARRIFTGTANCSSDRGRRIGSAGARAASHRSRDCFRKPRSRFIRDARSLAEPCSSHGLADRAKHGACFQQRT